MPDRPSTKDARREAAREKSRQMRELEARRKRRNRVLAISAGVVAVVLVIGFVALAITRSGSSTQASATPPGVTADGGIEVGQASAPHTVTIFQDYQCPVCKQYEAAVGPWLDEQVQAGTVKLDYRVLNFLDDRLRQDYSTRAANAAYCVAGQVPNGADFYAFNTAMYLEQPEEGAGGLTDSRLISIAQSAGADVGPCIADRPYEDFVQEKNSAAFDLTDASGAQLVGGTPTVLVDGQLLTGADGATVNAPSQDQLATALGVSA